MSNFYSRPSKAGALPGDLTLSAAPNNFCNQEELKEAFAKIDGELVFDRGFYVKTGTYLTQSGLDEQYLSWLYKQCLLKKPRSLNGLYYPLFPEPNMAELFKAQNQPRLSQQTISGETILCPVCGNEHNTLEDECPFCGLRKKEWGDPEALEKIRRVFALPPSRKAAFHKEWNALFENLFEDVSGLLKRQREIYQKYGIT